MVVLDRLELPTHGLGNHCSIHLSYRTIFFGGEGGIRTFGTFLYIGFQDQLLKPLGQLSTININIRPHDNNHYYVFCGHTLSIASTAPALWELNP